MKGTKKLIRLLLVTMVMMVSMIVPAFADEVNEKVKDARNGVLQIRICYETKDGTEYVLGGGSAFLINEDTIVTCYHVTHQLDEYGEWANQNIDGFDNNKIIYKVVVRNDITLEAKIDNKSEKSDFSILKLEQPIANRKVLPLNTIETSATQQIFALGFPDSVAALQSTNTYTYDDVTILDGRVTKTTNIDGVDFIQHNANLGAGYSGGPLVNDEGEVVGYNDATYQGNNYSVAISELTKALDDLGISYTNQGSSSAIDIDEEDETVDIDDEEDTEIEEEETTAEVEKPTVADKDDSEDEKDEKEGGLSKTMLIAIIAVVAVVIIIIIILIIALGGKKNKVQPAPMQQRPGSMPMPQPQTRPQMPSQSSAPQAPRAPQPPQYSAAPSYGNEGAGETTVLNEGAGETTVLGAGAAGAKTILRLKNGDRIVVNRPEFTFGKERRRVDYCVADNNSVSRVHAKVVNRGGQIFLVDLNATNGTFVNGNKLSGGQEMPLNSGDRFKLADEEFQVQ